VWWLRRGRERGKFYVCKKGKASKGEYSALSHLIAPPVMDTWGEKEGKWATQAEGLGKRAGPRKGKELRNTRKRRRMKIFRN